MAELGDIILREELERVDWEADIDNVFEVILAIELSDRLEIQKQNRIPPEIKAEGGGGSQKMILSPTGQRDRF